MRLVERNSEIHVLDRLFSECEQGNETVAVIRGAIACGKTSLLLAVAEHAVGSGAVFLGATASRIEQTLPLGVLNQLFRGSQMSAAMAARAAELLDDPVLVTLLHGPEPGAVLPAAARLFDGLRRLLLELSSRCPVVMGVDDLQYADIASLQFLSYLVRRPIGFRVFMLLSECTQMLPADRALHAELLRQPNCQSIRLAPLSQPGVATLLAEHLTEAKAQRLAATCHQASGGNPLLAHALAEDCPAAVGAAADHLVPGDNFRWAVSACLYRCEPGVVSLAQTVAVLAESPSPAFLGELLNVSADSASQGLNVLSEAGLLDGGRFRHEAAREAVLDGMSAEERAALHSRIARALHLAGATSARLAKHLVAGDHVEAAWAVPVLTEAAEQALVDKQPDVAVRYLRRAHDESSAERQRAVIKAALARVEWRIDPASAARHLPELVTASRRGLLERQHVRELIYYLLWHGRTCNAVEVIAGLQPPAQHVAEENGMLKEDLITIYSCLEFSYPELAGSGRPDPCGAAEEVAAEPDSCWPSPLSRALSCWTDDITIAAPERILEKCSLENHAQGSVTTALMALLGADQVERAAFWCDSLMREAPAQEIPLWHAVFSAFQGLIEMRRGNLAAAERHSHTALTLLTPKGWGVGIGVPLAGALLSATASRKLEDATAYVRMPVPEAMLTTPYGLLYLHARGSYYLAANRLHAALDDFQSCGERMSRWALDLPALIPWRTGAAEVYLRLGDRSQVKELSVEQLTRLRPEHVRTRGISLRMLALTNRPSKRLPLLREAAEALRESGARLELAHTFADLSQAYQELGETRRAQMAARQARILAEQCGAKLLKATLPAESVDKAMSDSAADSRHLDSLSYAERRVAWLAAQAYTNRQIAGKLYVTVSTVEQHLTSVYRKLGVKGRADLPMELQAGLAAAEAATANTLAGAHLA